MNTELLGTVRASSWPTLFDCAHRWYWQNVVGLRLPSSGNAALGTAIHAGTAAYDAARINGDDVSVDLAVEVSLDKVSNPDDEVIWDRSMTRVKASDLATKLTERYCNEVAPSREYVAVEITCSSLDILTRYGVIRVTGTVDRIRLWPDGRKGLSDLKSGARVTKVVKGVRQALTAGHHMQLGIYTLMAEHELQETLDAPAEIVALQTTKAAPVGVGEIADVKTALIGTDEIPGLIEIAAHTLQSGVFPPNPKSILCSNKYCPAYNTRCHYHN